ncbi:hypothetical protein GQ457_14G006480 [Hibiscus cannabinus]
MSLFTASVDYRQFKRTNPNCSCVKTCLVQLYLLHMEEWNCRLHRGSIRRVEDIIKDIKDTVFIKLKTKRIDRVDSVNAQLCIDWVIL